MILTFLTFVLVFFSGDQDTISRKSKLVQALGYWQQGFFGLMGFTLQMMMILVFGYALAIFKPVNLFLRRISETPKTLVSAVLVTASLTMISGILNWGFGLIVGAVLARFMHEALLSRGEKSNPALLAACGYLGMGIWHGGLSGSAPLSVADSGHFLMDQAGVLPVEATIFSVFNLGATGGLFFIFLGVAWFLSKVRNKTINIYETLTINPIEPGKENYLTRIAGLVMLVVVIVGVIFEEDKGLGFISLNWVNFLLSSFALIAFRSIENFSNAVASGLKSSADIFIQFPFYAGILALITDSGLLMTFSSLVVEMSNPDLFPLVSFFSAAVVNLFVPSGGGQWAIQGPIILETAATLGLDKGKMVMVFAYGDQISNLLQPFWALPLLAITGVSVKNILPYTLMFFLVGLIWLGVSIFFVF